MTTLSLMPGDNFKIGDYVYIISKTGISQEAIKLRTINSIHFKKKLSTQDRINIKLGISFDKVCPNSINGWLYKITMINKHNFETDLIKEEDFKSML